MPSTRGQKEKARKSREMDMVSDFDNLDILKPNENANQLERELASAIEVSSVEGDTESNIHPRDELRNFSYEKSNPRLN